MVINTVRDTLLVVKAYLEIQEDAEFGGTSAGTLLKQVNAVLYDLEAEDFLDQIEETEEKQEYDEGGDSLTAADIGVIECCADWDEHLMEITKKALGLVDTALALAVQALCLGEPGEEMPKYNDKILRCEICRGGELHRDEDYCHGCGHIVCPACAERCGAEVRPHSFDAHFIGY